MTLVLVYNGWPSGTEYGLHSTSGDQVLGITDGLVQQNGLLSTNRVVWVLGVMDDDL